MIRNVYYCREYVQYMHRTIHNRSMIDGIVESFVGRINAAIDCSGIEVQNV